MDGENSDSPNSTKTIDNISLESSNTLQSQQNNGSESDIMFKKEDSSKNLIPKKPNCSSLTENMQLPSPMTADRKKTRSMFFPEKISIQKCNTNNSFSVKSLGSDNFSNKVVTYKRVKYIQFFQDNTTDTTTNIGKQSDIVLNKQSTKNDSGEIKSIASERTKIIENKYENKSSSEIKLINNKALLRNLNPKEPKKLSLYKDLIFIPYNEREINEDTLKKFAFE